MSEAVNLPPASDPLLNKIWGEIQTLGLESHIAQLDARGYTVIEPELACPNGLAERMLEACLQVAERRNGERPDLAADAPYAPSNTDRFKGVLGSAGGDSPVGDLMQSMLLEDRVFEEALMNPVPLAIATYLCGYGAVLSSMGCFVKGPNITPLALHCDASLPSPLPPHAMVCNMTYALTPFNRDNGSTAFVPGSHRWCRAPMGDETRVEDNLKAVPVECPAGSIICWHGNTWHGAFNRTASGLRVSVPVYFARPSMRTQEGLIGRIPEETLARNSARFAVLTHQAVGFGWGSQEEALEGAQRAIKYGGAYLKELGVNPALTAGSHFA